MNIAILGYGREGKAAHAFMKKAPQYKGASFHIYDKSQGAGYLNGLDTNDLIVRSPGISLHVPEVRAAMRKGVPFTSVTQLFFEHAKGIIVGITGTKGKGTVATLTHAILKASGKDVYLAGNIGVPALTILPKLTKTSVTVLELSSFQLDQLPCSPHVAVVLEISPDHMDAHKNMREYVHAKAHIAKHQKKGDLVFYIPGNRWSTVIAQMSKGKRIPIDIASWSLFSQHDMRIPGVHNFQNAVVAAYVARTLMCPDARIVETVRKFRGVPQRLELVRKEKNMLFYNDSGSTNPHSTAAAIQAFSIPTVLIAGGKGKGLSYDPIRKAVKSSSIRAVVLLGENAKEIAASLETSSVPVMFATTLERALHIAVEKARKSRNDTDERWSIVFSPGSASFDMFANSKERGKIFNALVKSLTI